ncbi:MAG: hypothetical protein ACRDAM_22040, partial [Casimicrobium sp.]
KAIQAMISDSKTCPPGELYSKSFQKSSTEPIYVWTPNAVGKTLLMVLLPNTRDVSCKTDLQEAVLQTQFAIYRFWRENKQLPADLSKLPELKNVVDPYAKSRDWLEWNKAKKELRSKSGEIFRLAF